MVGAHTAEQPRACAAHNQREQRHLPKRPLSGQPDQEHENRAGHGVGHDVLQVQVQQRRGDHVPH